ncbi:hypothetical protein B0H63DRAFT_507946 [Podospora didyma]|uniref:Uncharacterized protein n=1 Tax=Podospora didyma TaxID=330526 RepID=A0AAE0NZN1_9PEZI|nr:hypothetical protein B0H63DRAFT_507946 [Podospora didyma]
MQLQTLPGLALLLVPFAAADCWDRKCSIDGLGTFACSYACSRKGYSASGYENYYQLWPPHANTVCTCGTFHSDDCGVCSRRGTPCKSRKQESNDFYHGRVPNC